MCASFLLTRAALQSAFTSSQSVSVAQMADTSEPQPQSQQIDRKYLFLFFFFFFSPLFILLSHTRTLQEIDEINLTTHVCVRGHLCSTYLQFRRVQSLSDWEGRGVASRCQGVCLCQRNVNLLYILDILVVAHDIPMNQPSSSSSPPITLKALLTNRRQFQRHRRPSEAMYGSCCRHGSNKDEGM